jgi:small subunit ribosomal protein S5
MVTGFSVRANHFVYDVCQALGIQDLGAKIMNGKVNPITIVKTMFHALESLHKTPSQVAQTRGRQVRMVTSQHAQGRRR